MSDEKPLGAVSRGEKAPAVICGAGADGVCAALPSIPLPGHVISGRMALRAFERSWFFAICLVGDIDRPVVESKLASRSNRKHT